MSKKGWLLTIFALLIAILAVLYVITAVLDFGRQDTVGICYASATDSLNAPYRHALSQALRDQGYTVLELDADNDQAKQLQQIKLLADRGSIALLVEPVMAAAADELEKTILESGLPTVLLNRKCNLQHSTVGADMQAAGQLLAEAVDTLPNGGDVNGDGSVSYLLIAGPEDHIESHTQMEKALKTLEVLPSMELLSEKRSELTKESGQRICSRLLSEYGRDVEVILCCNGAVTAGAAQAMENSGWQAGKDVYILGIGMDGETKKLLNSGAVAAVIYPDYSMQAASAARAVQLLLSDAPESVSVQIPYRIVTSKNIDSFLP